jgi:hypothetical protein
MEVSDVQISATLKEALTCYLGLVSRIQSQRDAKLPLKGKNAQTDDDLSDQEGFEMRIAASEICLEYVEKIAAGICHWSSDEFDDDERESQDGLYEVNSTFNLDSLLPGEDEQAYLDIISGKWIEPTSQFSAGPSGTQNHEEVWSLG